MICMMSRGIRWGVYINFPGPMIFMMSPSITCVINITFPGRQAKSSVQILEDILMEVQKD